MSEEQSHEMTRWLRGVELLSADAGDILEAGGWAAAHPVDAAAALADHAARMAAALTPDPLRDEAVERTDALVGTLIGGLPRDEMCSVLVSALCIVAVYMLGFQHMQMVTAECEMTERTSPAIRRQIAEILGGEA